MERPTIEEEMNDMFGKDIFQSNDLPSEDVSSNQPQATSNQTPNVTSATAHVEVPNEFDDDEEERLNLMREIME